MDDNDSQDEIFRITKEQLESMLSDMSSKFKAEKDDLFKETIIYKKVIKMMVQKI